jgi:hypothetical protein
LILVENLRVIFGDNITGFNDQLVMGCPTVHTDRQQFIAAAGKISCHISLIMAIYTVSLHQRTAIDTIDALLNSSFAVQAFQV